jgi:hypothetical protein
MTNSATQQRVFHVIIGIATKLDRQREDLVKMKRKADPSNPEHRRAVQIIDHNLEHLQRASIELRKAAESVSKLHL